MHAILPKIVTFTEVFPVGLLNKSRVLSLRVIIQPHGPFYSCLTYLLIGPIQTLLAVKFL